MMAVADEVVLSVVDGRGIATVTINRVERNNAYNGAVIDGLARAVVALVADSRVRALVLRGNGKHFQAGADLNFLREVAGRPPEINLEFSRRTVAAVEGLRRFPRPTVALVHGGCFGGGVGLVAACDMAVATSDAVFALSEVRWGISPAPIMGVLTHRLGPRALGRFALTGERFNAAQALRIGLVHEVCAPGALDEAVAPLLEAILSSAPDATSRTKALIEESLLRDGAAAFSERLAQEGARGRLMPEAAEGLASFAEKRPPNWYPKKA
ncbi:MAG TPA: enoyl-CoA hydratase-related protein [Stellaceae bacterium]|nr:enoyl-CoA hydratase-related protein [Stellaceae bacterium]